MAKSLSTALTRLQGSKIYNYGSAGRLAPDVIELLSWIDKHEAELQSPTSDNPFFNAPINLIPGVLTSASNDNNGKVYLRVKLFNEAYDAWRKQVAEFGSINPRLAQQQQQRALNAAQARARGAAVTYTPSPTPVYEPNPSPAPRQSALSAAQAQGAAVTYTPSLTPVYKPSPAEIAEAKRLQAEADLNAYTTKLGLMPAVQAAKQRQQRMAKEAEDKSAAAQKAQANAEADLKYPSPALQAAAVANLDPEYYRFYAAKYGSKAAEDLQAAVIASRNAKSLADGAAAAKATSAAALAAAALAQSRGIGPLAPVKGGSTAAQAQRITDQKVLPSIKGSANRRRGRRR